MTPAQLIDGYLEWLQLNRGRSAGTVHVYRRALDLLLEFLGGRDPREATDDDLVLFTGLWLHRRKVGARARRPYIAAVRGFHRWLHFKRLATHNPAAALHYPKVGQPLPRTISLDNYEKLMWAPDLSTFEGVRDSAMIAVLGGCGIRVTGLIRMNTSDVLEEMVAQQPRLFIRVREKGDKQRKVPLPREAEMQLRVYMGHEALREIDRSLKNGDQVLFVTTMNRRCPAHEYRGEKRRFNRRSVNNLLRSYGERERIPLEQLHPHALRHLFGTELAEGDVDVLKIQDLMGHADPKSSGIYTHLATRKLVKTIDDHGPLAKIRTPASELLKSMQSAAATAPKKKSTT